MSVVINDPVDNFAPPPHIEVKRRRRIWGYFSILFLVLGLGLVLNQINKPQRLTSSASGGVVLSMIKDKTDLKTGDEFTVLVLLDTKQSQATDADIYLLYPEDSLQATAISGQSFLSQIADPGGVGPGTAFIKVNSTIPVIGSGIIAEVKFKVVDSGSSFVQFTNESIVTDKTQKGQVANLLDKAIGLKFEVK